MKIAWNGFYLWFIWNGLNIQVFLFKSNVDKILDSDYPPRPHTVPDRARLDSIPDHQSSDAGESDTDTSETLSITDVRKINQQPGDELVKSNRYDPNR